jgi:hypothetical protein
MIVLEDVFAGAILKPRNRTMTTDGEEWVKPGLDTCQTTQMGFCPDTALYNH